MDILQNAYRFQVVGPIGLPPPPAKQIIKLALAKQIHKTLRRNVLLRIGWLVRLVRAAAKAVPRTLLRRSEASPYLFRLERFWALFLLL